MQFPTKIDSLVSIFLPPILWAGLIFFLSSQPSLPSHTVSFVDYVFKKSAHIFVYAVLYLLLFRSQLMLTNSKKTKYSWLPALVICLVYAISDEYHQSFVPGRFPSIGDVGFDMLGSYIALLKVNRFL